MGLTMGQRRAVTKTIATRYTRASKAEKGRILGELCATTGWHRNHARKALKEALTPKLVRPRAPRPPRYGPEVVVALAFCWAVLGAPTGKRLAPVMAELVARLRRFEELVISDVTAGLLVTMSAATMDRRLAPDRAKMALRGRSHTKSGSLLKTQIPIRTRALSTGWWTSVDRTPCGAAGASPPTAAQETPAYERSRASDMGGADPEHVRTRLNVAASFVHPIRTYTTGRGKAGGGGGAAAPSRRQQLKRGK